MSYNEPGPQAADGTPADVEGESADDRPSSNMRYWLAVGCGAVALLLVVLVGERMSREQSDAPTALATTTTVDEITSDPCYQDVVHWGARIADDFAANGDATFQSMVRQYGTSSGYVERVTQIASQVVAVQFRDGVQAATIELDRLARQECGLR